MVKFKNNSYIINKKTNFLSLFSYKNTKKF